MHGFGSSLIQRLSSDTNVIRSDNSSLLLKCSDAKLCERLLKSLPPQSADDKENFVKTWDSCPTKESIGACIEQLSVDGENFEIWEYITSENISFQRIFNNMQTMALWFIEGMKMNVQVVEDIYPSSVQAPASLMSQTLDGVYTYCIIEYQRARIQLHRMIYFQWDTSLSSDSTIPSAVRGVKSARQSNHVARPYYQPIKMKLEGFARH